MKELFEKWEEKYPNQLVIDGIINKEEWERQETKILFVLKEAYGDGNTSWSLTDYINNLEQKDYIAKLWKRIAIWTNGILHTDKNFIKEYDPNELSNEKCCELLKKIAVVNIKKKDESKKSSEMNDIESYAKNDKDLLKEQIDNIQPDIIVCGYTCNCLDQIYENTIKDNNKNPNWFYWYKIKGKRTIVLDFYHPANQYPDLLNYYGLMNIYQLVLKKLDSEEIK